MAAARQLHIEGTNGNDQVRLDLSGATVQVRFNGRVVPFSRSDFDRVFFSGLPGDDSFVNNTGIPTIAFGGAGNDRLIGSLANDTLDGGPGDDVLSGRSGDDSLQGGLGDDFIFGMAGNDALAGSAGNDSEDGGEGNDRLRGHGGDDVLVGGDGRDDLDGDVGDDRLFGGAGDDHLRGGSGRDRVSGGSGSDRSDRDRDDSFDDSEGFEFVATLTGPGGATGKAEYEPGTSGGFPFDLEADHLGRNATYAVRIAGVSVGQLTTDAEGEGDLRLTSRTLPIETGTLVQLADLAGEVILQGTFAVGRG